jgi:hypothetical protein
LIRNLHTTLATGTDHAELLDLAVYLHVHVTRRWLRYAGAPTDLGRRAVFLARRLARERDETTTLAVAEYAVANHLLAGGALDLGRVKSLGFSFGPVNVGLSRMGQALEAHEPDQAARIAEGVDPERNRLLVNRSDRHATPQHAQRRHRQRTGSGWTTRPIPRRTSVPRSISSPRGG